MRSILFSLGLLLLSPHAIAKTPDWARGAVKCEKTPVRYAYRTLESHCEKGFDRSFANRSGKTVCILKRGYCLPNAQKKMTLR